LKAYGAHNRLFAITASGRFALVPRFSRPKDLCIVSPGMKVPLIARSRDGGRFSLVGDAYIHGTMDGEIMHKVHEGKFQVEDMIII